MQVDELRARHRWCRKLLQSRDWRTIRAGTQTQVEAIIAELSLFEDSISHENLRFRDPTHRAVAIDQAESDFASAERHALFEKAVAEHRQACSIAKELLGLERFDETDLETEQLMEVCK